MRNDLRHNWNLLWVMTENELRARYKNTMFGFLWLIANPLLQMLIIGFIFPLFVKGTTQHYFYYLFTGLLVWNFFSFSLAKTTSSIVNERTLIKKAFFLHAIIPLSIILSNLLNYMTAFLLFLIPLFFLHTLTITSGWYFIVGLSLLVIFTVGVSLLCSALNVRFRDVNFFIQALLIIWFYATPIVYTLNQIPHRLRWLWQFNPLTSIVQFIQHALIGTPLPDSAMFTSNCFIIFCITILGIVVFQNEGKNFDDWI